MSNIYFIKLILNSEIEKKNIISVWIGSNTSALDPLSKVQCVDRFQHKCDRIPLSHTLSGSIPRSWDRILLSHTLSGSISRSCDQIPLHLLSHGSVPRSWDHIPLHLLSHGSVPPHWNQILLHLHQPRVA